MFLLAVFILLFLSVGLAFVSLRKELERTQDKKAREVQKSLEKGRVLFYSPSSPSSSEE